MTSLAWCDVITGFGEVWCAAIAAVCFYGLFKKQYRSDLAAMAPALAVLTWVMVFAADWMEKRILGLR